MKFILEYLHDFWTMIIIPELRRANKPIQAYQIFLFVIGSLVALLIWYDWRYSAGLFSGLLLAVMP